MTHVGRRGVHVGVLAECHVCGNARRVVTYLDGKRAEVAPLVVRLVGRDHGLRHGVGHLGLRHGLLGRGLLELGLLGHGLLRLVRGLGGFLLNRRLSNAGYRFAGCFGLGRLRSLGLDAHRFGLRGLEPAEVSVGEPIGLDHIG